MIHAMADEIKPQTVEMVIEADLINSKNAAMIVAGRIPQR